MQKYITTLFLCLIIVFSFGQKTPPKDLESIKKVELAKQLIGMEDYAGAANLFQEVVNRPLNPLTTFAQYMLALMDFKQGNVEEAKEGFEQFLIAYPNSKYSADAHYHAILLQLKSEESEEKIAALQQLFDLREHTYDQTLSEVCANMLKKLLFYDLPIETVSDFFSTFTNEKYRKEVMEALCYQKYKKLKRQEVFLIYNKYLTEGGEKSDFVETFLPKVSSTHGSIPSETSNNELATEKEVKIAIMFPFFLSAEALDTLTAMPQKSMIALELYEGIILAIQEYMQNPKVKITVKVYDTQKDNTLISKQLAEMEYWKPHIVVGEIYNKASRFIADWTSEREVAQLIPLSPSRTLIENRENVFLMRSSGVAHAQKMAEFAFRDLGLKNIGVWNDGKGITNEMANAFVKQFRALGGYASIAQIDSTFEIAKNEIQQIVPTLKSFDATYIPITNEESMSLILSMIDVKGQGNLKVMCSPDIENSEVIDRDLKDRFQIYYTSSYVPDGSSDDFQHFLNLQIGEYGILPTENHIRGYDIGKYLISASEDFNPSTQTMLQLLHDKRVWHGLHENVDFGKGFDNLGLRILQFTPEGTVLVK
jgi:ABC-type branched-subunit amino acid transport system substrate-binding protein/outer membrane protein assembly factor BamD (BamD/ComL family)